MANTYRTVALLLGDYADNTSGAITPQIDRNYAISMAEALGGYNGLRAQTGMLGGVNSDWSQLAAALAGNLASPVPPVNFNLVSHASATLTTCPTLFGVAPNMPFVGGAQGDNRFDLNSLGSGSILWTPLQGGIFRELKIVEGCVVFDLGAITTEVPLIVLERNFVDHISCLLRDGSIANGLTRKLDKLLFRYNYMTNNDRGLFVNGNGASRAWVIENHVDNCARFGILVGCATPHPQQAGFDDFKFYTNNLVERESFPSGSANGNSYIMFGRYGTCLGNMAGPALYAGVPNQHDFEPYYWKNGVTSIMGNIQTDAGAGQGMFMLKGGARTNSDNSAGGWDYAFVGNVGYRPPDGNFSQAGIWMQNTDTNVGCNIIETQQQYGVHINKMSPGDVEEHSTNLMMHDNIFICRIFGSGIIGEGAHNNVWATGNMFQGPGGSGQSTGVRFATLGHGAASNYRAQGNTVWGVQSSAGGRLDCTHIKTDQPTDSFTRSLPITDNVFDVSDAPDQSNAFGVTFEGTGDVENCLIDGNHFVGFSSAARLIRNLSAGGNRAGRQLLIRNNPGFNNDNTGTGTIPIGQASVTITHGLPTISNVSSVPDPTDITIQPTSFLKGAKQLRITAITATTFDVTVDAAVTTNDFTFAWRCRKTKWTFN